MLGGGLPGFQSPLWGNVKFGLEVWSAGDLDGGGFDARDGPPVSNELKPYDGIKAHKKCSAV